MSETKVRSLDLEDPLEKEMETHSSILVWRIPWTADPGGYSPWGLKESDMTDRPTLSHTVLYFSNGDNSNIYNQSAIYYPFPSSLSILIYK